MELSPIPIGIGPVPGGGACNRELRRILLLGTSVHKLVSVYFFPSQVHNHIRS